MKEKYFLGITFILSWGVELLLLATGHTEDGIFSLAYLFLILVPALAVFITKYAVKEPFLMNLWLKPERKRTMLYCILGWLAPVVLIAAGCVLYFLIFHDNFDWSMSAAVRIQAERGDMAGYTEAQIRNNILLSIVTNLFLATFYNIFISIGEEFAWRGYFLQMLCEKHPVWRAVLINAVVWGIWYLPLVAGTGLFYGKSYSGYPVWGCLNALLYFLSLGIIYSFLTIKTRTCLPAVLANACIASMSGVGIFFVKNADSVSVFLNPLPTSVIGGAGFLIAAAIVMYCMLKDKVRPEPEKEQQNGPVSSNKRKPSGSLKEHTQNKHLQKKR